MSLSKHFIFWSAFILYELCITILITKEVGPVHSYLFYYTINIGFFYLHNFLLQSIEKKTSKDGFVILTVLIIFLELILYFLLIFLANNALVEMGLFSARIQLEYLFIIKSIWRGLYFIGLATGYFFIVRSFTNVERAKQAESRLLIQEIILQKKESTLLKTQNAVLRNQINPHFLFNVLNSIYKHTYIQSPAAADAIISLSEIMRYALKDNDCQIYLQEELEQVENLIKLYQFRSAGNTYIDLRISGDLEGIKFPPLILMTLVENLFKYGRIDSENRALIEVKHLDDKLTIKTENSAQLRKDHNGTKIGLSNIKLRLKNEYGDDSYFANGYRSAGQFYTLIIIENIRSNN